MWLLFFVFRKREEEQRRRDAVQQVSTDKRRGPAVRPEQETISLVNIIEDLTMNDSVAEAKVSSKAERTKNKVERHKGKLLLDVVMCDVLWNCLHSPWCTVEWQFKGIVHWKLKFPFPCSHHVVNMFWWHFIIHVAVVDFHGQNEFHLTDA